MVYVYWLLTVNRKSLTDFLFLYKYVIDWFIRRWWRKSEGEQKIMNEWMSWSCSFRVFENEKLGNKEDQIRTNNECIDRAVSYSTVECLRNTNTGRLQFWLGYCQMNEQFIEFAELVEIEWMNE